MSLSYDTRNVFSLFSVKYMGSCPLNRMFFLRLLHHISLTVKDFSKIPTVTQPRDPQLEAEILSQKITLISESEFIKIIENKNILLALNP